MMRLAGLVLAGGRGSRMGGTREKPLLRLDLRPMIAHVLDRFPPATHPVLISANRTEAYQELGLPVIPDRIEGYRGPLAGLDAAEAWLNVHHRETTHLLALAGDTPFLPGDVAERLSCGDQPFPRIARHGGRLQPTVGLWSRDALGRLADYLTGDGNGSIKGFLDVTGFSPVDFPDDAAAPHQDPFCNINTSQELAVARSFILTR